MYVTADNFEESKKKNLFYLSKSIHPVPEMQNHLIKYGILDFDFIITSPIEKAIIEPIQELRSSKRPRVMSK
jgi:hypothetical protein